MENKSKVLKKILGQNRIKVVPRDYKYDGKTVHVPKSVGRWLNESDKNTFENLTRGLRVTDKERDRAKVSLHHARKIVIKKMIAYCYTDSEICMELEITGKQLAAYKKALYKEEIEALRKSGPEDQFVQYRHNQMEVIKDIDMLIEKFKDTKAVNALANALKTKSEILRDIANKAQEMGFMEKRAQELKIVNDIDLTALSNAQLLDLVERQQQLVSKVAKGNVTSLTEIKNAMKVSNV